MILSSTYHMTLPSIDVVLDNEAPFSVTDLMLACEDGTLDCYNSHDPHAEMYTDISVGNEYRQWMWFLCNEAYVLAKKKLT